MTDRVTPQTVEQFRHRVRRNVFTPYGYTPRQTGLIGFNGEYAEPAIGIYLLGLGYRGYQPRLMRLISPDSWSPFGDGGINAYSYCRGNPIERIDPSGHFTIRLQFSLRTPVYSARVSLVLPTSVLPSPLLVLDRTPSTSQQAALNVTTQMTQTLNAANTPVSSTSLSPAQINDYLVEGAKMLKSIENPQERAEKTRAGQLVNAAASTMNLDRRSATSIRTLDEMPTQAFR